MPRASKYRPARRGDHSSRRRIAAPLKRPTRGLRTLQADFVNSQGKRAGPALPSYLALHHAGFSVPPMLPSERWALTPPFHPCQTRASKKTSRRFCLLPVIEMLRPIRQSGLAAFSRRRFILCGTIRGPVLAIRFRSSREPSPLALPGASPFGSLPCGFEPRCPDFPPALPPCGGGTGDRPTYPPALIIHGVWRL